jgi:hypothetical protein
MGSVTCEICGQPADLSLTEIVTPRGVVVTRHYCKAHRPRDSDVAFKEQVDAAFGDVRAKLRRLEEKVSRMLDERGDRRAE